LQPSNFALSFALRASVNCRTVRRSRVLFGFDGGTKYAQSEGTDYSLIFSPCESRLSPQAAAPSDNMKKRYLSITGKQCGVYEFAQHRFGALFRRFCLSRMRLGTGISSGFETRKIRFNHLQFSSSFDFAASRN